MGVGVGLSRMVGVTLGSEVADGAGLAVALGLAVAVFSRVEVAAAVGRLTVGVGPAHAARRVTDKITREKVFM